ncbi:MAG TPA: ATP-binding protein [Candidatus Dormibacteraeota bacterium]|jgi:two-component system OmpR family sensor kinase|nr:ATP-binding protein [Candidatus Dormibacteraeota bacterium]
MRQFSLRTRILVTILVVAAIGVGISDFVITLNLQSYLLGRMDAELTREAYAIQGVIAQPGHKPTVNPPPHGSSHDPRNQIPPQGYVALLSPSGKVLSSRSSFYTGQQRVAGPQLPKPLPVPRKGQDALLLNVPSQHGGDPDYRIAVRVLGNRDRLVVGSSLGDVDSTLGRLVLTEGLVGGGVVLVLFAAGYWLVRIGLSPLEQITATADAIAAGDLRHRAPEQAPGTEVGRLAAAFNAMLSRLERSFAEQRASEERLRRFLADASHELRTPLTSLRGYAELFRRGASRRPADLAKVMSRIEEEAARMGVLVDDLLLLARLDQRRPLQREPVDLAALVRQAVEAAHVVEPDRSLALEVRSYPQLVGDHLRLRQVVDNLLSNVRVHTPAGTPARVIVEERGGFAVIDVVDEGPGIGRGQSSHLFERFYRTDDGRSRGQGGSGLGLAIVRAIANAHGGDAELVTSPPEGPTTFRVTLREAEASEPAPFAPS